MQIGDRVRVVGQTGPIMVISAVEATTIYVVWWDEENREWRTFAFHPHMLVKIME